jgi:hypothetical protein
MKTFFRSLIFSLMFLFYSLNSAASSSGSLLVLGEAGRFQIFQKVKAIRCNPQVRGECDASIFFELNKAQSVPVGFYLVGFENSMYPSYVEVKPGLVTELRLEKLRVPSEIKSGRVRVYRDFSRLVEQRKIYLAMFSMNRHFFRLDSSNFGDYYLAGSWEREVVQKFTYDFCPKLHLMGEVPETAKQVCQAWNRATQPIDLRDLFNFSGDGTFAEMWVTFPGDVIPSMHGRYLVAAPMTPEDFVSVFPGSYRFQAEGKKSVAISVTTGGLSEEDEGSGLSLIDLNPFANFFGACTDARVWKTELRAFCTNDKMEGCNRSSSKSCQKMQ